MDPQKGVPSQKGLPPTESQRRQGYIPYHSYVQSASAMSMQSSSATASSVYSNMVSNMSSPSSGTSVAISASVASSLPSQRRNTGGTVQPVTRDSMSETRPPTEPSRSTEQPFRTSVNTRPHTVSSSSTVQPVMRNSVSGTRPTPEPSSSTVQPVTRTSEGTRPRVEQKTSSNAQRTSFTSYSAGSARPTAAFAQPRANTDLQSRNFNTIQPAAVSPADAMRGVPVQTSQGRLPPSESARRKNSSN